MEVWVTGLGFITSIGCNKADVKDSLINLKHGITSPAMLQVAESPVKVAGTIDEFDLDSNDPEDWQFPSQYKIPRSPEELFTPCPLCMVLPSTSY